MNRKLIGTFFCCVILSSQTTITDTYALSQHAGINHNKADTNSQALVAKKPMRHGALVEQNNEITKDRSLMKTKQPEITQSHATLTVPDNKEVKRTYQRLTIENTNYPNDDNKQQLLKHIERQIQILQMQQEQRQRQISNISGQTKHVRAGQNEQQMSNPKQSYANTHTVSDQNHSALQNLSHQRVVQRRVRHSNVPQKKPPKLFEMNGQVELKTQANKDLLHQSSQQQNKIESANPIKLPHVASQVVYPSHFIHRGPIPMNTHHLNGSLLQQVPLQHILIPVSALSSNHILKGQGLAKNKVFLVNPMFSEKNALHINSNREKSKAASTSQLSTPLPATVTTETMTSPTTTTELPSTTISTPPPAFTSVPEYITAWNKKILNQELMEISMKKQKLEIIKLQLEIRALQREEKKSLPEVEDDDVPERHGNVWQRRSMFPFFG